MPKYLILGAGPTGLGAGIRLKELAEQDFLIVDGASQVGGLATSFKDDQGFTWDIGGHVQFSHYHYFDQLMLRALGSDGWLHHQRESWVWMCDRFIPYPFQNNIRHLPQEEMWDCIRGLVQLYKQPASARPNNFKEWIHATFGSGLARTFMEPYNFKVWAFPPEQMDFNWIGERVAVTDLERVLQNILFNKDDLSWGPNNTFQFPRKGGTGAIWEAVAGLVGREKIRLNSAAVAIDLAKKECRLQDGTILPYEYLLSTIPLNSLMPMCIGASEAAVRASQQLKYSSSNIVGVGLAGKPPAELKTKCWMYFPEPNCPFYRVTVFSNYSPENVPQPDAQWSLMAEVSESSEKPVNQDSLVQDVLAGMRATQLIRETDTVLSTWSYRAHHGYPTPFLGRDDLLAKIHRNIEPHKVYSRGRFGAWKYEVSNQDHSLMQGVEWANMIVKGDEEMTYASPARANAPGKRE